MLPDLRCVIKDVSSWTKDKKSHLTSKKGARIQELYRDALEMSDQSGVTTRETDGRSLWKDTEDRKREGRSLGTVAPKAKDTHAWATNGMLLR